LSLAVSGPAARCLMSVTLSELAWGCAGSAGSVSAQQETWWCFQHNPHTLGSCHNTPAGSRSSWRAACPVLDQLRKGPRKLPAKAQ
jgi:hypothetical protein